LLNYKYIFESIFLYHFESMPIFINRIRMNDTINSTSMVVEEENEMRFFIAANREMNYQHLARMSGTGRVHFIQLPVTNERHVYLPDYQLSFEIELMDEFPMRFRQMLDVLLIRAGEDRSRRHRQPKFVKPVSSEHGRQFFMTPKLLAKMDNPPNCSICMDSLIPEGMKRKKVWQMECGCIYHKGCINRWHREDSRCPNCRTDCSDE